MVTTQIMLTTQQNMAVRAIAQQTSQSVEELMREAVEQFIHRFRQTHRQALLQQARGMWQDRADLPTSAALRGELDRFVP